jgi:sialic acid synthase SpsE
VIDQELEGLAALRCHRAVLGIADRSQGPAIPTAAVTAGASIVEKRIHLQDFLDVESVVRECEQTWASMSAGSWTIN